MQPALTPETPAAAAIAPASITPPVETPTTDAARERVKPLEDAQVQPATDTSLAPIEPKKLPEPKPAEQVQMVAPSAMAANDPLKDTAIAIEKQLAQYIGERLTAEQAKGLTVDVVLAKSNAATRRVNGNEEAYDIALMFKSQAINDMEKYKALEDKVLSSLRAHPALNNPLTESVDKEIHYIDIGGIMLKPGEINWKSLSLKKLQLEELMKPHPLQHGTPITGAATTPEAHACTGANCSGCASPAKAETAPTLVAENVAAPVAPAAAPITEAAAPALQTLAPVAETVSATPAQPQAAAPAIEQSAVGAAKPAALATSPVTQVTAPAEHRGITANPNKLAIGA